MSRFRWSCVVCGAVVALACSFEAARARDKPKEQSVNPNPPAAGNVAPAGVQPSRGPAVTPPAPSPPPRATVPAPAPSQPMPKPSQPGPDKPTGKINTSKSNTFGILEPPQAVPKLPAQPIQPNQPQVGQPGGKALPPFQPSVGRNPQGQLGGTTVPGVGPQPAVKLNPPPEPPGKPRRPPGTTGPTNPGDPFPGLRIPSGKTGGAAGLSKGTGLTGPPPTVGDPVPDLELGLGKKPGGIIRKNSPGQLGGTPAPSGGASTGKPKIIVEDGVVGPPGKSVNYHSIGPAPSGIARPGVPEKPSKTFNESRSNSLGVAPDRTNSIGKPKIVVEPVDGKPKNYNSIKSNTTGILEPKPPGLTPVNPTDPLGGTPVPGVGDKPTADFSTTKSNIKNLQPKPPEPGLIPLNPIGQPGGLAVPGRDPLPTGDFSSTKSNIKNLRQGEPGGTPGLGNAPNTGQQKRAILQQVPKNGSLLKHAAKDGRPLPAAQGPLQTLLQTKDSKQLRQHLEQLKTSGEHEAHPTLAHLNLDRISGVHQDRLANGDDFQHWQQTKLGQQLNLGQQFEFQQQGDLSRRMNLGTNLINAGGWAQHRQHGAIAAGFTSAAFSVWYAGGGCYPSHSWCPVWSPWVDWCWWDTCPVLYDPRPYYCIPVVYDTCLPWVYYDYPVWNPLPVVSCGTWIDVTPVSVTAGQDVQLLAVRFVDNGHPEQNLGSRYRVWVRNNSPVQIVTPFSVLLLASNEQTPTVELPQSGVVVPSMDIGETQTLDIRLPLAANRLGTTPEGYRVPFTYLHALVDSHQQIPEAFEDNNGAVLLRTDILPVDPEAFSTDLTAAAPESLLTIAGEGFGPEPGQVIVSVYGQQVQAEIQGWYDLGIRFTVPNFELTQPVDVEILVVRGDSAVSNPLTVRLAPHALLEEAAVFPESPIPSSSQ